MFVIVILSVLLLAVCLKGGLIQRLDWMVARVSSNRFVMLWTILLALGLSALLMLFVELPEPRVHDEFSYLLQADTFVQRRLFNPPHPMWEFFETFHLVHQPVYVSKYPPAQGVALALGQVLWKPILGVWLSIALAMGAMFWMLRALVPARWALMGTALTFFNPQILQWNWSFWGGGLSLLGGALLFGGSFRLMRDLFNARHALCGGLGMLILSLSRPFEGVVISLLAVTALAVVYLKRRLARCLLPACLLMGGVAMIGASLLFFYNFRITGHPLTMPYVIHENTYSTAPIFLWEQARQAPKYNHAIMESFHRECLSMFLRQRQLAGYYDALIQKITLYKSYSWHGLIAIVLLSVCYALKREVLIRHALVLLCLFLLITISVSTYTLPHYGAAAVPLFVLLIVVSLRYLSVWRPGGRPAGYYLARIAVLVLCGVGVTSFVMDRHSENGSWEFRRAALIRQLKAEGGKHLIVVRYAGNHSSHNEWVYNEADIDGADVVWARDMGDERNRRLFDYFNARKIWVLEPDNSARRELQPLAPLRDSNPTPQAQIPGTGRPFHEVGWKGGEI